VAKIELAIKDAIHRGARRQLRLVTVPLRREVRRLRRMVSALRRDVTALKDVASTWERAARATPWTAQVSEEAVKAARLSAGLIKKLRTRLGLSQAALARLAGVSPGAVVHWERGGVMPSGERRRALVGLRKLGRREVKRLLATTPAGERARKPRRRRPAARKRKTSRRAS
jgi:DNA-binding transcriptional regulator YiaG